MNTLTIYPFCEALATGLLHSLWLFPLLVGINWLVARQLSQSRHRYLSHLLTLLTCLVTFLGLVGWRWWTVASAWSTASFLDAEIGPSLAIQLTDGFQKIGLWTTNDWTVYLAIAYAGGLFFVLGRYLTRYLNTRKMRRGGLLPTPEQRTLFAQLKAEILPEGRADWRITDRIRNVLVVGILRPVILFPVGLVNQLTTEEVTAILRHELTHLRRHDPLWNAVQELIRALFFYHPVIYWLCGELDREREFACDDAVLLQTNPGIYARALLRVANYSLSPKIPLTMAATSTPDFTQRIQRLFSHAAAAPRPGLSFSSRSSWLSPLAVLPVLLLLIYAVVNPYQLTAQTITEDIKTLQQEIVITGKVVDGLTGTPLIGTAISIPTENTGTITDFNGEYRLKGSSGNVMLRYSYVGYLPVDIQFVTENANNTIDIMLYSDQKANITFGGDSKRSKVMRLDRIVEEGAEETPVIISGRVDDTNDNSFYQNVLMLIDGVRHTGKGFGDIQPEDIESIDVLKDKAKIEALGFGTDFEGAILIKTKKQD